MQFKNIIVVSLASMAAALPAEVEKRTPTSCSQSQTAKCCDSLVENKFVALLGINALQGLNCINANGEHPIPPEFISSTANDFSVIGVLNDAQCSQSQSLACCSSGDQYGLINIGNVCVPVSV
ncbi:MAG: hypothetical protein Q9176_002748 [Flavoplaca citrina]